MNTHPLMQRVTADMAHIFGRDPVAEQAGLLSPSEARSLAELDQKTARVIPIFQQTRLERVIEQIEADRKKFISDRTDELLKNRETFAELMFEVIGGSLVNMAVVALRDAYEEQGKCWDGISAFGDLMRGAANLKANSEWPKELLNSAPLCSDCPYSRLERDPYGTGDSPFVASCQLIQECPWGKQA